MKYIITSLLIACSVAVSAQKIKSTEIDKFTGAKRVQTSMVPLLWKGMFAVNMELRSVDTSIFLSLYGNKGVGVVGTTDAAIFLFEDKTTFEIYPTSIQSYDVDKYGSRYDHQYSISREQVELLSSKRLIAVRRYFNSNYADIEVTNPKHAVKIQELAALMLKELPNK